MSIVVSIASHTIRFAKSKLTYLRWVPEVILTLGLSLFLIVTSITLAPAFMPVVTLENDNGQRLVYIGMQHIGSKEYYAQVNDLVVSHRRDGYIVLHEGVGLNGDVTVNLKSCSKVTEEESITGLVSQPNCIGELHPGDKYADLSQSDFISLYSKHLEKSGVTAKEAAKKASTKGETLETEKEEVKSSFIKYIGLKIFVLYSTAQYFYSNDWRDKESEFPVILGERNKIIIDYVANENKTVTAYGLEHLSGVKNGLVKKDTSWRVISIDAISSL